MQARQMRVSDDERERVAEFIRRQAMEGRLDHDELEERLGGAYSAKTAGELEDLIEDLPHRLVPRRAQRPAQRDRPPVPALVALLLIGLLALPTLLAAGGIATALVVALVATVFALGFVFGPFVLIGFLVAHAARRRRPRHWSPRY